MKVLKDDIGECYTKQRHGIVENVKLIDVRRDRVKLQNLENGNESVLPIAKFEKFYTKKEGSL